MINGFASNSFLKFSSKNINFVDNGLLKVSDKITIPYFIINKSNDIYKKSTNYIISPICFSGSPLFNIDEFYKKVIKQFAKYELKGGFIQTRDTSLIPYGLKKYGWGNIYVDGRTNYRLSLNMSFEKYIQSMKRDSKLRIRKILRNEKKYSLTLLTNNNELDIFSDLYSSNAEKKNYSQIYRFSNSDWYNLLLNNNNINLYLLKLEDFIISGSVITTVNNGFDYTFMAYCDAIPDVSRANLYFIYRHLYQKGKYLDLGGGIKENDSLSQFKMSMGGLEKPFLRYRFLFDNKEFNFSDNHIKYLISRWP